MEPPAEGSEQVDNSSPAIPPVPPSGFSQPRRKFNPRVLKKIGIVCLLVLLSPFVYKAVLGDLQVVSEVDGAPIRYKDIAVSLAVASETAARRGAHEYSQKKKREMEMWNLTKHEAMFLRVKLKAAGDTERMSMPDEELSAWGRQTGRIERSRAWAQ